MPGDPISFDDPTDDDHLRDAFEYGSDERGERRRPRSTGDPSAQPLPPWTVGGPRREVKHDSNQAH